MDLLYSTGNYSQYFVIIYNGKESENMHMYTHTPMYVCVCVCVCVCTTESLCYMPETNTIQ